MTITVPERGLSTLSREEWSAISVDHRFWKLVSANIIQVEAGGRDLWRLRGTCYVGRAVIGGHIIQVVEKFSGALEALIRLGALKSPKVERITAPVNELHNSTAILVAAFLESVKTYLSGAKQSRYVVVPDRGALIGGRLNIIRTAALRSRGIFYQAAFDRTVLSANIPLNQCIYAALREIEHLARVADIPSSQVATARGLRIGLSECLPSILHVRRGELAEVAAREAEGKYSKPAAKDAASLAGAILDAAGFGGAEASTRTVERAWFVNLETFFEEAVRRSVRDALRGVASVSGPRDRPSLFRPDNGKYRANPDVIISRDGEVIAIADAKYKDFTSWPSTSDVHEILAHASAYDAKKAILFYPDETGIGKRSFGCATTGCELWAVGLAFENFVDDISEGLRTANVAAATLAA